LIKSFIFYAESCVRLDSIREAYSQLYKANIELNKYSEKIYDLWEPYLNAIETLKRHLKLVYSAAKPYKIFYFNHSKITYNFNL
jgi:hypothetical protein